MPNEHEKKSTKDAADAAKSKKQFKESEDKMLKEIIKKNHSLINFHFKNPNNENKNLESFDQLIALDFENDISSIECMMFQEAYSSEQAGKIVQKKLSTSISGSVAIHQIERIAEDEDQNGLESYAVEFIIQENCIPDLVGISCGGVTIYHPWIFISH